jgi:hypothetical protein
MWLLKHLQQFYPAIRFNKEAILLANLPENYYVHIMEYANLYKFALLEGGFE